MKVFDIEDIGGTPTAKVTNSRNCTTCRECIRDDISFASKLDLGKKKDVFEFHVEAVGQTSPQDIVFQSLQILKEKANKWMDIVKAEEQDDN